MLFAQRALQLICTWTRLSGAATLTAAACGKVFSVFCENKAAFWFGAYSYACCARGNVAAIARLSGWLAFSALRRALHVGQGGHFGSI